MVVIGTRHCCEGETCHHTMPGGMHAAHARRTFSCNAALPRAAAAALPPPPAWLAAELLSERVTVLTPSTNLVRKMTLALLNMPSFSDTTMNCTGGMDAKGHAAGVRKLLAGLTLSTRSLKRHTGGSGRLHG